MKKTKKLLLAAFALLVALAVTPVETKAETKGIYYEKEQYVVEGQMDYCSILLSDAYENGKVVNVKCSNTKILKVKAGSGSGIDLYPQKPGEANVTFYVKKGNKKQKCSVKVYVEKSINPAKSIKLDGKTVKPKRKTFKYSGSDFKDVKQVTTTKYKDSKKVKVSVTPKNGWRLWNIGYTYHTGSGYDIYIYDDIVKHKTNDNGVSTATIKCSRKIDRVTIIFQNEETGILQHVFINRKGHGNFVLFE